MYVQLGQQIKRAIAIGALLPGERLPTVKGLAIDLKLNPNTVARVYRDLEREGVIATAPGRGSFIRDNGTVGELDRAATDTVVAAMENVVREARSLGVKRAELHEIADESIGRWYSEEQK